MRKLGLLPRSKEKLHDFNPRELNAHFVSMSISPSENIDNMMGLINSASDDRFTFMPLTLSLTLNHRPEVRITYRTVLS